MSSTARNKTFGLSALSGAVSMPGSGSPNAYNGKMTIEMKLPDS